MPSSRLGCPLSLKIPNMGNPGFVMLFAVTAACSESHHPLRRPPTPCPPRHTTPVPDQPKPTARPPADSRVLYGIETIIEGYGDTT